MVLPILSLVRVIALAEPSRLRIRMSSLFRDVTSCNFVGRWNDAEELGLKVLEARKRMIGAEHPDTLTIMNNLALTWKEMGRAAAQTDSRR